MDAIKARIEKAAKKKLEEAKNKLKEELLKALGEKIKVFNTLMDRLS
jgi:hypothetical protein